MKRFLTQYFASDLWPLLTLFGLWLLEQVFLFSNFGIVTSYEAAVYIKQASYFLQAGRFATNNFAFYSTEILIIALAQKLNTGYFPVVLVQWFLSASSLYLFYRLLETLTENRKPAFFFSLLLVAMLYYQLYNVYLFTESIFFSLSIGFIYYLFTIRKLTVVTLLLTLLFLIVLIFTRPTGLLFIPGTLCYLFMKFNGRKRILVSLLFSCLGLVLFYFLLNRALGSGGAFNFLLPYLQEHVICGIATVQYEHVIHLPVKQNSVEGLFFVVKSNTGLFLRLAIKRLVAFWGVQRPYYSGLHNFYVAAYFYAVYILIVAGLKNWLTSYMPEAIFLVLYVALVSLTVMLSCDEWHNRFLYSILPLLLLLAAGAFFANKRQK